MQYGILEKDGRVSVTSNQIEAARSWMAARKLFETEILDSVVSTVFLMINHGTEESPLWFETIVFGSGPLQGKCDRYETIEEAKVGHEEMCEEVKRVYEL